MDRQNGRGEEDKLGEQEENERVRRKSNVGSTSKKDEQIGTPGRGSDQFVRWTILSVTTLSSFMVAIDTNIVTIAVPVIGVDLGSGVSLLGWVVTAYILATASLLLQFGKVGDRYGRKHIYLVGFALFGVSSALCGLSFNVFELIGFRVLQGFGAAMLTATAAPLLFESFPPNQRGAAMGVNSVAWAVGSVVGPVAGGFLVSVDWRLIFYINVPIAAAAVLIGTKKIPSKFDHHASEDSKKSALNPFSSALLAFTVTVLLMWLTFFDLRYAFLAVVGFAVLIVSEIKSSNPLFNRELAKNRGFVYAIIGLAILQVAYLGIPFALTFYYQLVIRLSPILTGILLVPISIAMVLASPAAGRLFDKLKTPAIVVIFGTIATGVAEILLSLSINAEWSPTYISVLLLAIGAANGFVWIPMISTILKFVRPGIRGIANGTAFTLINIASAASIAIVVAVSATFLSGPVVSQIYLGNVLSLSQGELSLFRQGIAEGLLLLGIVNFIALPLLFLVLIEQRKKF